MKKLSVDKLQSASTALSQSEDSKTLDWLATVDKSWLKQAMQRAAKKCHGLVKTFLAQNYAQSGLKKRTGVLYSATVNNVDVYVGSSGVIAKMRGNATDYRPPTSRKNRTDSIKPSVYAAAGVHKYGGVRTQTEVREILDTVIGSDYGMGSGDKFGNRKFKQRHAVIRVGRIGTIGAKAKRTLKKKGAVGAGMTLLKAHPPFFTFTAAQQQSVRIAFRQALRDEFRAARAAEGKK